MRPARLSPADCAALVAELSATGWTHDEARGALCKTFRFPDFSAAFGWMTRVALVAERIDHHPNWLNVWNRVEVTLTTHDVKGLTVLDRDLARAMDRLAASAAGH